MRIDLYAHTYGRAIKRVVFLLFNWPGFLQSLLARPDLPNINMFHANPSDSMPFLSNKFKTKVKAKDKDSH